jgi:hypothetical protein
MRAVLDQGHEADLWEGALATAGLRAAEGRAILPGVGDVEAGAVSPGLQFAETPLCR